MEIDYRKLHDAIGKGKSYEANFGQLNYRAFTWSWEKKILCEVLQKYFHGEGIRYLDFACGTGRIISFLESKVTEAYGVDVSKSMLAVARQKVRKAKLTEADLTKISIFKGTKFNLISTFRFFLNAQPELRKEAISSLSHLLDKDGYLVFNIHMNHHSATAIIVRLYKYLKGTDKLEGSSLLNKANILEWETFLKKIKKHDHPFEKRIWVTFDQKSLHLISKEGGLSKNEKNYIVKKLNQFLKTNRSFFHEELNNINLPNKTLEKLILFRKDISRISQNNLQYLNRSIFNALYLNEITEWSSKFNTMSIKQVASMVKEADLEIIDSYHSGIFPVLSDKTKIPISILRSIEYIASHIRFCKYFSQNIIYVCKHSSR